MRDQSSILNINNQMKTGLKLIQNLESIVIYYVDLILTNKLDK